MPGPPKLNGSYVESAGQTPASCIGCSRQKPGRKLRRLSSLDFSRPVCASRVFRGVQGLVSDGLFARSALQALRTSNGSLLTRLRLVCPSGGSGLAGSLRAFLRGQLRSPSFAALQSALATERDGGRVLLGRVGAGDLAGRFLDQPLAKLVHVRGAAA